MDVENQRAMKLRSSIAKVALAVFLVSAGALAEASELRVLLAFDNAGHQVRQIVRNEHGTSIIDKPPAPAENLVFPDISALGSGLERGFARLVWLDEQGYVSAVTQEPDPRVSHAPTHISGADGSRVGERKGAWLVTGPNDARSLVILMPGDERVGLAFEQWEVLLGNDLLRSINAK